MTKALAKALLIEETCANIYIACGTEDSDRTIGHIQLPEEIGLTMFI